MTCDYPIIFLPGAGNHPPDLSVFKSAEMPAVECVYYPGWERYAAASPSAEDLIADLASQIQTKVPAGPIFLIGLSLGGHFGYAAALHLQALGREIAGFCAIDSFMIDTAEPTEGWKYRAFAHGVELLRKGRIEEFVYFARSKFWRLLIRLAGGSLTSLVGGLKRGGGPAAGRCSPALSRIDPLLEAEVSMRLRLRVVAPWLPKLDLNPAPLNVPAALLRTGATAGDDTAWRRRCPNIVIHELPGHHGNIFAPENVAFLRGAFLAAQGQCGTANLSLRTN